MASWRTTLRGFARLPVQHWRAQTTPRLGRDAALRDELEYWRSWLATGGGQYREEYAERFAPDLEVDDVALRETLELVARDEPSVLDVGAGPCSSVGSRFRGRSLAVTAVDPLAAQYDRLLAEAAVTPRVRTQVCPGEDLVARFGRDAFDVVYARNAIDHSVDPFRILEQMIGVVRPGGFVILRHGRNEALKTGYVQLHRWNFDCRDGRFVIWRPRYELDVQEALGARADVRCHIEPADGVVEIDVDDPGWIVCKLRKQIVAPHPSGDPGSTAAGEDGLETPSVGAQARTPR